MGRLCESHNHDAADLHKLPTDFRGEADIRFCAVLLRLADILDFDRTRTPEEVYDYLGLSRRNEPRTTESDVEWRKHLCSEGFRFPVKRSDGYPLSFIAGPNEPGVEHDVHQFLDIIGGELKQCRALLTSCSDSWRTFPLPGAIKRSDIRSNGYRYGDYRFTLNQTQVMDLLMGENLYQEPYVFVRELTQNALDASRHRRFIERARGNPGFEPEPIQVRQWVDQDGNHLLKVGSSYYRTADFRAEILRVQERTNEGFVPISRFGIGLLSCFIAGDRVEINTLRHAFEGGTAVPIRLSLNGLHGFFTLQTPHLPPKPMPAPDAEESGYRATPGTSIAVRLDSGKEKGAFDLEGILRHYVAFPSVPVELDGQRIGGDPAVFVDRRWCEPISLTLTPSQMDSVGNLVDRKLKGPFRVKILPIDLTRHSPTHELKGQIVSTRLVLTREWEELLDRDVGRIEAELRYNYRTKRFGIAMSFKPGQTVTAKTLTNLSPIIAKMTSRPFIEIGLPLGELPKIFQAFELLKGAWLSHNGIAVPVSEMNEEAKLSGDMDWSRSVIALADSLRPELSISRDKLVDLHWSIRSAGNLALYRALDELGVDLSSRHWELFSGLQQGRNPPFLGDLLEDHFLSDWVRFPIIATNKGLLSLLEIRKAANGERIEIFTPEQDIGYDFHGWCAAALIQTGLDTVVEFHKSRSKLERQRVFASSKDPLPVTAGHRFFPPLTFIPFSKSSLLQSILPIFNSNHPFAAWLLEIAPELSKRYPGLFNQIRSFLVNRWEDWEGKLTGINGVLDRLRELHPNARPPRNLILKEKDFEE